MNVLIEMGKSMVKLAENFGPNFAVTLIPNQELGGIKISVVVYVDIVKGADEGDINTIQMSADYTYGVNAKDTMGHLEWADDAIKCVKARMEQYGKEEEENARNDVRH